MNTFDTKSETLSIESLERQHASISQEHSHAAEMCHFYREEILRHNKLAGAYTSEVLEATLTTSIHILERWTRATAVLGYQLSSIGDELVDRQEPPDTFTGYDSE